MNEYLRVMMNLRTQCVRGFHHNWKFSLQDGLRHFVNHCTMCTEKGVIVLRNDELCVCHRMLHMK